MQNQRLPAPVLIWNKFVVLAFIMIAATIAIASLTTVITLVFMNKNNLEAAERIGVFIGSGMVSSLVYYAALGLKHVMTIKACEAC